MDDFSDDGFDDLNVNVLDELENNAIQFTQAQLQPGTTQQQFTYDEFEDDDFEDTVLTDDLRGNTVLLPERPGVAVPTAASSRLAPQQPLQTNTWGPVPIPASHFRPQAINAVGRPPGQIPAGARLSQYGARQSQAVPFSQIRPPPIPRATPANDPRWQTSQAPQQSGKISADAAAAALQARIEELELKLQTKDGEIDIVRRNLERHKQDHDREVQALKKQTAEQVSKSERAAEAAKVAQQTATTELEFTRRDLREEVDRAKRREKDGGTPKRNPAARVRGVADGFEDVEMAVSPSKGSRGRNAGAVASIMPDPPARLLRTPTKSKRKRPNIESPIMALETDEGLASSNGVDAAEGSKDVTVFLADGSMAAQRNPLGVDVSGRGGEKHSILY